jgi:mono/diheme cytochrome c family protein
LLVSTSTIRGWLLVGCVAIGMSAAGQDETLVGKFYRMIDGNVDARTYNGFRRYRAVCNHCHGQGGLGSTFGPSLVERLPAIELFRRIVREGTSDGQSIMKGYSDDPNITPYIDDIYGYLQARADGALGRGRPTRDEH